jgi:hypothetical protein
VKPARANSFQDPISKKPFIKKGCWSASGIGPEFKPQDCKKKKALNFRNPNYTLKF